MDSPTDPSALSSKGPYIFVGADSRTFDDDSPLLPADDYGLPKPPPNPVAATSTLAKDTRENIAPSPGKRSAETMATMPPELHTNGIHTLPFGGSFYAQDDIVSREHSLPPSTPPSLSSGPTTPSMSSSSILLSQGEIPQPGEAVYTFDPSELIPSHGMTAEEAVQANLEAAEQAEGEIVPDDGASDAGYESDTASSASTSLSLSVREYMFENGRRYHKFRAGRYNFPNDEVEQEREDMKHAMMKTLCQKLHYAPIGPHPQEILDIGTGTGIWAIESESLTSKPLEPLLITAVGDQFESANILGVDLSPIQPDWVPPNVRFMVDDAESPWLHPRNHFDYIHTRHTVMGIKDWPKMFRRSLEYVYPSALCEAA